MDHQKCIFCEIIAGNIPSKKIAENDDIIVIQDIHPKAPIHYLIIPKKHVADLRSLEENDHNLAAKLLFMAQELSKDLPVPGDFTLVMNNGASVGQCVFHAHLHFLAGKKVTDL